MPTVMLMRAGATVVKAILFLYLATQALYVPLAKSSGEVSYQYLEPGRALYRSVAHSFLENSFLPSMLADAALVGLFPSWRILRVALPTVAALTILEWAHWMWYWYGPAGKYPNYSISGDRWLLVSAGPIGIVAAAVIMFFLAKARRPAAPIS